MAEIGPVYFPVFSFSPGRLPLSTLEELLLLIHSVCGTREELDIYIYIHVRFAYPLGSPPPYEAIVCAVALPCRAPWSQKTRS